MTTWAGLIQFKVGMTSLGLAVPEPVARGLAMIDTLREHAAAPSDRRVLGMTDKDAIAYMTDSSIRRHTSDSTTATVNGQVSFLGTTQGLETGFRVVEAELLSEIREAMLPQLDDIIAELRPAFEETAEPLVIAAGKPHSITYQTTSDDIILRDDPATLTAWRDARQAWAAVDRYVIFRRMISTVFDVSPTKEELLTVDPTLRFHSDTDFDWTVCFATGTNWGVDRSLYVAGKKSGFIDWLAIAGGGLTLNTPTEVREKIRSRRMNRTPGVAPEISVETLPTYPRNAARSA